MCSTAIANSVATKATLLVLPYVAPNNDKIFNTPTEHIYRANKNNMFIQISFEIRFII